MKDNRLTGEWRGKQTGGHGRRGECSMALSDPMLAEVVGTGTARKDDFSLILGTDSVSHDGNPEFR